MRVARCAAITSSLLVATEVSNGVTSFVDETRTAVYLFCSVYRYRGERW